jgi:hypothetical protein
MLCRSRRGKEDGIVAKVEVRVVPQGRGYRLDLYHQGVYIGEYEWGWSSEEGADVLAKVREAEGASDLLLEACKRTTNGKITVRWNYTTREKEIRAYRESQADPGLGAEVLERIPKKPYWRKP